MHLFPPVSAQKGNISPVARPWWSPPNPLSQRRTAFTPCSSPCTAPTFCPMSFIHPKNISFLPPDLAARVHLHRCPSKDCKYKHFGCLFGCTPFLVGVHWSHPAFAVPPSRAFYFVIKPDCGKSHRRLWERGRVREHPSYPQLSPVLAQWRTRASSSATRHVNRRLVANTCWVSEAELDACGCDGCCMADIWSGTLEAGATAKSTVKMGKKCHPTQSNSHKSQTTSSPSPTLPGPTSWLSEGPFFRGINPTKGQGWLLSSPSGATPSTRP